MPFCVDAHGRIGLPGKISPKGGRRSKDRLTAADKGKVEEKYPMSGVRGRKEKKKTKEGLNPFSFGRVLKVERQRRL